MKVLKFIICFIFCISLLITVEEIGLGNEDFNNPFIRSVEIIQVDREAHGQSTMVMIKLNPLVRVEDIDYLEFHDSKGHIYKFNLYDLYSTDQGELYYMKELPFLISKDEIKIIVYDSAGAEYEWLTRSLDVTVQSSQYDGSWSGTTNQNRDMSFTVSNDIVTMFNIEIGVAGIGICTGGSVIITRFGSYPIMNDSFTITSSDDEFIGTFSSNATCDGTWYYEDDIFCMGSGSGTWDATKNDTSMSPGPAELNSPSDAICDYTPTYTWNAVQNSTWYYLWVNDSSGKLFATWYTAKQTNCASGTGQCSVTPDHALEDGSHKWWIQTWNNDGYGPWSSGMTFDVGSVCLPAKAILVSPGDYISDDTPTYTWNAVQNSTWYYLWVNDSSGKLYATWYTAKQTNCASGTGQCSVTPDHALEDGSHKWWIQTWNSSGYGPWSDDMEFTLGNPDKAKLISPSGSICDNTPTYRWNAVSGATWYYLWVNDGDGKLFATWYTAKQTNCASGTGQCSVTPDHALEDGSHKWWIQTWNSTGYGPWSDDMSFTVEKNCGPSCQFSGSDCGWESHAGGSWSVVNSAYYYTEGVAGSGSSASYPANYTDFDYKTKIKRAGSHRLNSNRIIVRGTPDPIWGANNWYKGYVLQYTTDGRFSLIKWDSGTTSILYRWTDSDYLALGATWNFFRIVARGSTIEFYINGIKHLRLTNANLTSGRVGIGMNRDDSSTGNGFWVDYVTLSTEVGSDLNADDEIVFEDHHIISDTDDLHQTILSEEGEYQTP